jgi:hypothetical protein
MKAYLYFVDGDSDSEKAIHILEESGIQFKKVPIDEHENGKSMFHDLQTTEFPSLATAETVYAGLENIKIFAKKTK